MSWTSHEIAEARVMREAGVSYDVIATHFGVIRTRVMYALDPEFAERERQRAKRNFHSSKRGYKVTGAMRRRIIELAEAGLSYEDIGKAMGVYHGRSLSASTIRKTLRKDAPHIQARQRGNQFGSDQDPRMAVAA